MLRRRLLNALAAAPWLAVLCCAGPKEGGLAREKVRRIETEVAREMARQGIPGMSVAVAAGKQLRWAKGFGMADLENQVAATATTVYRLASISKTITAVAVMQLAEKGKLDLDAPVQKYVPAFPKKPWPITSRQLLGHLGGIRHYGSAAEVYSTRHYKDLVEPLAIFKDDPLLFEPGTRFSYSTYGYSLLGCAVESASGRRFTEYVREVVLKPAGMTRTETCDGRPGASDHARGYRLTPDGVQPSVIVDITNKVPGGGFCSTVEDLARLAGALARGALVSRKTLDQMFTPQRTRDGQRTAYGLGWYVQDDAGHKLVHHGGNQQGVTTLLMLLPQEGVSVALMANLEMANLRVAAERIAQIVLE